MSLTIREIALVADELQPLVGSRVTSVWVHGERALTLELHGRAGGALLLVSAEADRSRLHAATRRPPQPEFPFPFQAVLRREIEGARLARLAASPGDRVVAIELERARGPVQLVAELTGRHGNLFLVGPDGVIQASAGRNLSLRRSLVPGEPYVGPSLPAGEAGAPAREERPPRFAPAWVQVKDDRAAPMLDALHGFLRATLPLFEREQLRLGEELEAARRYLDVMRLRLGERLAVGFDTDPAVDAVLLPPGLLLTLVENAVEHGVQASLHGAEILVRSGRDGPVCWIEVADSGPGLLPGADPEAGRGVGLANARARLALAHGDAARLTLSPRQPGGCLARIELPLTP